MDPLSVLWLEIDKRIIEDKFEDLDQVQSESDSVHCWSKKVEDFTSSTSQAICSKGDFLSVNLCFKEALSSCNIVTYSNCYYQ